MRYSSWLPNATPIDSNKVYTFKGNTPLDEYSTVELKVPKGPASCNGPKIYRKKVQ